MTKYYILLYKDIDPTLDPTPFYIIGAFTSHKNAQKYMKNKDAYRVVEVKGSACIDEECQEYLIGDTELFCLIRYEHTCHKVLMDVLYVSSDPGELQTKCNMDFISPDMHGGHFEYYYNRQILDKVDYAAEEIVLHKEDLYSKYY